MKILNYGSINIDSVYTVPRIVRPGETLSSTGLQTFAGGKGANQSVALAKAGAKVWQAGKIGQDGTWILEKLEGYGVNTDLVHQYQGPTGQAFIQVTPEAQNSIVLFGGGNLKITQQEIDHTLSHFSQGDFLVLQNEINETPYIITAAKRKGLHICLNPAPFEDAILSWPLDLVDILMVNEIEAEGLSRSSGSLEERLTAMTHRFQDTDIILTAGESGAFFGRNDQRIHTPVVKAEVRDTTAAGDTFLGFYLASVIAGSDAGAAMERASRAAGITVSRQGAMDAIPFAGEVA
ncbi:MAG: ribokinase [Desulfobacteraceae bacterium]|nr:MAG: ribokinase [Desulfobacteraceae bacterium]